MIDWTITLGNILTIGILGITGLVAYFGWQRAVDAKFSTIASTVEDRFNKLSLQITEITSGDVRELRTSVANMQNEFHEWTKSLHTKNNELNTAFIKFTTDYSVRVAVLEEDRRERERRETERRTGERRG